MAKLAVFFQETGEEGVIEYMPGETLETLLARAPFEWVYRYSEDDYMTQRENQRERLLKKYGDDEDYDVDDHMEQIDMMREWED